MLYPIPTRLLTTPGVTITAIRVYCYHQDRLTRGLIIKPTVDETKEDLNIGRANSQRALHWLVKNGFLELEIVSGTGGKRNTKYKVNLKLT